MEEDDDDDVIYKEVSFTYNSKLKCCKMSLTLNLFPCRECYILYKELSGPKHF